MSDTRKQGQRVLHEAFEAGSLQDVDFERTEILDSNQLQYYINDIYRAESVADRRCTAPPEPSGEYIQIKQEYFQSLRHSLDPLFRQTSAKFTMIVHDIIIESCLAQSEIERDTQLPRSTISELLHLAKQQGLIGVKKFGSSRIKYYIPKISSEGLVLNRLHRFDDYVELVVKEVN